MNKHKLNEAAAWLRSVTESTRVDYPNVEFTVISAADGACQLSVMGSQRKLTIELADMLLEQVADNSEAIRNQIVQAIAGLARDSETPDPYGQIIHRRRANNVQTPDRGSLKPDAQTPFPAPKSLNHLRQVATSRYAARRVRFPLTDVRSACYPTLSISINEESLLTRHLLAAAKICANHCSSRFDILETGRRFRPSGPDPLWRLLEDDKSV